MKNNSFTGRNQRQRPENPEQRPGKRRPTSNRVKRIRTIAILFLLILGILSGCSLSKQKRAEKARAAAAESSSVAAEESATATETTTAATTTAAATKAASTSGTTSSDTAGTTGTQTPTGTKVIYLTFDDGPGPYTDKLLKILDQYNVKATFFVTNQYPKYQYCIGEEYRDGQAIGVHSYTHNYATIYRSSTAFWNDFEKMESIIVKQTGVRSTLMRFPGGSSNTVSRNYCTGIMSKLAKESKEKGYTYADWNAYDGDADDAHTASAVVSNFIRDVRAENVSIVLCHDIKPYTVEGIGSAIAWAQSHGYTFKAMTADGYTVHHTIAN